LLDYSKCIDLEPDNANFYVDRASAKEELGDEYGAIRDATKAIELDPKSSKAYYIRAYCKCKQEALEDAIDDFSMAGELGHPAAYDSLATVKNELWKRRH
jgi:tetratricopeptide (TPR) repeat protein